MNVLIIAAYEICYNPRLVKSAWYFEARGAKINVLSPRVGVAPVDVNNKFNSEQNWNIIEYDISKYSIKSRINWLYVSIVHYILNLLKKNFRINIGVKYQVCKALLGYRNIKLSEIDVIVINLVDLLPFATTLKKKYGAQLIYDSQEFFIGQYQNASKEMKEWVARAEKNYIQYADVVLATTNCMKSKLIELYNRNHVYRVRNLPFNGVEIKSQIRDRYTTLNLVWHGMTIYYESRGLNVLIEAVAQCKAPIILTLQGNINKEQYNIIQEICIRKKIEEKLVIKKAAFPDQIIESLVQYDIGLIGEMPIEDNQKLTSSNKLFEYIHAGLAVISSEMPGILETFDEFNVGLSYHAGNSQELAKQIDFLFDHQDQLNNLKNNAQNAASNLSWTDDMRIAWPDNVSTN